jgi:hypothetical protein
MIIRFSSVNNELIPSALTSFIAVSDTLLCPSMTALNKINFVDKKILHFIVVGLKNVSLYVIKLLVVMSFLMKINSGA